MKKFDEKAFVVALTERDEEAREFARKFNVQWLANADLQPIVTAIFKFRKEKGLTPSLRVLHDYLAEVDQDIYDSRWKTTLTELDNYRPDSSMQKLALDNAKALGTALAASTLIHDPQFQVDLAEGDGEKVLGQLQRFIQQWGTNDQGEGVFNIREAMEKLIDENAWNGRPDRIPCGVRCLDEWSGGGLRPRSLGVMIAPTGHGKSSFLMNVALYAANVEMVPTLFVTNELTLNEQTERFLVRMQKPGKDEHGKDYYHNLTAVQDDPSVAYKGLDRKWSVGLDKRLYVSSVDINTNADDIEEMMNQLRLIHGFVPGLIVIDYLERMQPVMKVNMEKEHMYIGQIAKELVRLGKRTDSLVWTAVQTNRGGLARGVNVDMTHTQGSIRQLQEAAFVGTLQKVMVPLTEDGEENVPCLRFNEHKQRHAAMEEREAYVKHELGRMFISKETVELPQDVDAEPDEAGDTPDHEKGDAGKIKAPWQTKG